MLQNLSMKAMDRKREREPKKEPHKLAESPARIPGDLETLILKALLGGFFETSDAQVIGTVLRGQQSPNRSCALRPERKNLQESPAPPGPKKSQKRVFFWGLQESPRNSPKNTRKCKNTPIFFFSGIFGDFLADLL